MTNQEEFPLDEDKVEERVAVAPPLTLMWWKFRKHKMALISAVVLIIILSGGHLLRVRSSLWAR